MSGSSLFVAFWLVDHGLSGGVDFESRWGWVSLVCFFVIFCGGIVIRWSSGCVCGLALFELCVGFFEFGFVD